MHASVFSTASVSLLLPRLDRDHLLHSPRLQVDHRRSISEAARSRSMGSKTSTVSSVLCCPCRCLFCGVLSCLFSVLTCILVVAGLVALVLYLLFRPHIIHVSVVSADLSDFVLTPRSWILHYNLTLGLEVCNPNKRIALQYHGVDAEADFEGQQFAHAAPPDFFQDTGVTSQLDLAFGAGESPLVGGIAAAGFRREAAEGAVFSINVKVSSHMKLKVWVIRVPGPKTKIDCPVRLQRRDPRQGQGQRPPEFKPTECRVSFF